MITYDEAHQLFRYDVDTGKIYNREDRGPRARIDCEAWSSASLGDRQTKIGERCYLVHRIIWLMAYGEWPDQIDHINHVRDDNRLENRQ